MTIDPSAFVLGKAGDFVRLELKFANRHGLVAGATGTGKTVTLQTMVEGFSRRGVPTFLADVKGDLTGLCVAGSGDGKLAERARQLGLEAPPAAFPCLFWDALGEQGHPLRATVSEVGPLLLARLLNLNDTQAGVLNAAFAIADDQGLLLLDLKDLRAILAFLGENAKALQATYGNIAGSSLGAIQRNLLALEREGGDRFFGEPALELPDLMRVTAEGMGVVSILAADQLVQKPRLYAAVLLYLLSELFETLPEAGDLAKPKLVLFFDEAHLLFDEAPKALVDKVEQVVRLIRSKGVGVYFVTQSPADVPDSVLAQLGARVQHALRAFTPKEQKAVRVAAETFRPNPAFRAEAAITELGVGEALVSTLQDRGVPSMVERALIAPPVSRVGPASAEERAERRARSPLGARYDEAVDRRSAYEILAQRAEQAAVEAPPARRMDTAGRARGSGGPDIVSALATSAARSIGSKLGREIVRGVLGSIFRGR